MSLSRNDVGYTLRWKVLGFCGRLSAVSDFGGAEKEWAPVGPCARTSPHSPRSPCWHISLSSEGPFGRTGAASALGCSAPARAPAPREALAVRFRV